MIFRRLPLWATATNGYVLARERGGVAVAVDAPPDPEPLLEVLAELDLALGALLITHGHVDHVGGAGKVVAGTGAAAYLHPDDRWLAASPAEQLAWFMGALPEGDFAGPERYRDLADGLELEIGGIEVVVVHTPGHTPGHCCFHLVGEGLLFAGDQLFAGSVGRTDLPGGDFDALMASMGRLLVLDDATEVHPGHGPVTTIGRERHSNPFLVGAAPPGS